MDDDPKRITHYIYILRRSPPLILLFHNPKESRKDQNITNFAIVPFIDEHLTS